MRALIAGLVSAAVFVAAGAGDNTTVAQHIEFNTRLLDRQLFDRLAAGPTIGDRLIREMAIFSRAGTRIGAAHEECDWTSSISRLCRGVYDLPLGQLSYWYLVYRTTGPTGRAITGGTGRYVGAVGVASRHGRTVNITLKGGS